MNELAQRLLELQTEYANRDQVAATAAEFQNPGWEPRSAAAIAEEYSTVLAQFIAEASTAPAAS